MSVGDLYASQRFDVAKVVALAGVSITLLTLLVVIGGCVVFSLRYPETPLPPFLLDAGKLSLGFLFGSFFSLVRDFIS